MLGYLANIKHGIALYFLKRKIGKIGTHVVIKKNAQILAPKRLTLGDYVYIGPEAYFQCNGEVTIRRGSI